MVVYVGQIVLNWMKHGYNPVLTADFEEETLTLVWVSVKLTWGTVQVALESAFSNK